MSNALMRRNSSKQGLQNLMRLTAQRSVEDAEEVERERRRRARDALRRRDSSSAADESSPDGWTAADESRYDGGMKPGGSPSLEEDEGFSDWTQRREQRRQQRMQELSQGGEEDHDEGDDHQQDDQRTATAVPTKTAPTAASSSQLHRQPQEGGDVGMLEMVRRKEYEEKLIQAEREKEKEKEKQRRRDETVLRRSAEIQPPNTEVDTTRDVRMSFTSKVFLQQEPKHCNSNSNRAIQEVPLNNRVSRAGEPDEAAAILEAEQRLEKIRRGFQQKENQELEQLRQRQAEAVQELEELKTRREDRRRVRQEDERRRDEEEQRRLARDEEERRQMKEDIERRRTEAAERMKGLSSSGADGEENFSPFSPKSPTHKITQRTESLNRTLKKSNSFKKTQPLVLLSKIDDKLEQYTHAVENAQDSWAVKASLTDLPSSPEAVASKKNLFETGETWNQSPSKGGTCKDVEGLKVGVANLITQWVKGPSDSKLISSRSADVKAGDVMQKKNMWEIIGDSGRTGHTVKASAAGKKFRFVVTGHGKYEKISADKESSGAFSNGKSDLYHNDF